MPGVLSLGLDHCLWSSRSAGGRREGNVHVECQVVEQGACCNLEPAGPGGGWHVVCLGA